MANVTVKVDGLDDLRRVLRRIADDGLKSQLKSANLNAAQIVVSAALPNVPVRTGRLRASVRALGSQAVGRAMAGGARSPGAAAVHWGRKRGNVGSPPGNRKGANPIKGRPFLLDAAEQHRHQIEQEYLRDIERLFDALSRR